MRPPPGYAAVEGPRGWAFALPEARDWVAAVLEAGRSLGEAASGHPDAVAMRGRGRVWAVPGGRGRWVVRPYRRGGALAAPLLGDRYLRLGSPRPVREALASQEATKRGIPTPRVLAGAVYPAGLVYRADLVTEYVPDALELAEALFGGGAGEEERARGLVAAGELLDRMARAGLGHPDLNARNILVPRDRGRPALVLDLDRCRIAPAGAPLSPERMLARLERSLDKLGRGAARPLAPEERARLRRAAGAPP